MRIIERLRPGFVLLLVFVLLVVAACGDGDSAGSPATSTPAVSFPTPETVPDIYMAIHTADLSDVEREDSEFIGTLLLVDGCLVVDPYWGEGPVLPVWNFDHRLQVQGDDIAVVDGDGEAVARVDQLFHGGGNSRLFSEEINDEIFFPVPDTCDVSRTWSAVGIRPLDQQPAIPTPVE